MINTVTPTEEMRRAFVDYDRKVILNNVKVGCIIGAILMPVGVLLDYVVYYDRLDVVRFFFGLRLLCSILIGLFWGIVMTPFGSRHPRKLGVTLAMFPTFFMSWMIYDQGGSGSTYYAGLNLVLLVVGFVLYWTFLESFVAVSLVIITYLLACWLSPHSVDWQELGNNLYFLVLTGIIVMTGSYFHTKFRFREFALRYELDRQRQMLEASNIELDINQRTLARQKQDLETVNEQLKQKQAQLVQQEKMASLGKMSAGIAHEINNPLNFVKMNLFTLRKKNTFLPPDHQAKYLQLVDSVEDGVNRVKTIVSDLRTFSHPDEISRDNVSVAEVVASVLRFLSTDLKDSVEVIQDLEPELTLWANQNKMIQVLLNLVQNSVDALKAKSFPNGERPTICISGRRDGDRTIITVRDNGPGIPLEHRAKIYDPFFTTKDIGQGMGLGLSICYGIVQEFQGTISVKTETGQYCEFSLSFPAHAEPTART